MLYKIFYISLVNKQTEIMRLEEFRNEYAKNLKFEDWDDLWAYLHEKCGIKKDLPTHHLNKVMEAYHQSRVNAISHKMIVQFSKTFKQQVGDDILPQTIGEQICLRFGAKWYREQLLNKEQ